MSRTGPYTPSETSPSPKGSAHDLNLELADGKDEFESSSYRSSMTRLTCGLYALMLIILGLVFSVTYVLSPKLSQVIFAQVYQIFLCVFSVVFLIYMHAYLFRFRDESAPRPRSRNSCDGHLDQSANNTLTRGEVRRSLSRDHDRKQSRDNDAFSDLTIKEVPAVHYGGTGINFYLRLGAIVFGAGAMIHNAVQIVSSFSLEDLSFTCSGPIDIIVAACQFIFTFVQTFFVFKNHKVVMNKHKAFVRFGLMHLLATNICRWFTTIVYETADDIHASSYLTTLRQLKDKNGTAANTDTTGSGNTTVPLDGCYTYKPLLYKSSPFLYPCVVQYSVIAAAMVYNAFQSVGDRETVDMRTALSEIHETETNIDCHKANKGLFLGLFIVLITLISVCIFMLMRVDFTNTSILVLYVTELGLLLLSAIVVVAAFARLHRLRFIETSDDVNIYLLLVSLAGVYLYHGFATVSSVIDLLNGRWAVTFLAVASSLLSFVQATMQVVFILDGVRRCALTDEDVMRKPGRALVTFLLLCNLSMAVMMMFDVHKTQTLPHPIKFYGYLPWSIVSHVAVPLIIFFRFHSSVCLSDIWLKAYKRDVCITED